MPLKRRLPKRGFRNLFRRRYATVSLRDLSRFESGTVVDVPALVESGLVKKVLAGVKVLGTGEIAVPLTLKVHRCSESARRKVEAAGGRVEEI
jgi:large subunit ribosomal protein L15